jgi:23S rRNA (uracil1939-C5)-methyltransferase
MNLKNSPSRKKNTDPIQEIEILRLASDGSGVGYLDGKTTFVAGMLPSEKGKVRITEQKKSYQRAEALEITEISAARQAPPCSVYDICGGCDLQHLNYNCTLEWKRQWVEDALNRIGGLQDIKVEPVLGMEQPWRYGTGRIAPR